MSLFNTVLPSLNRSAARSDRNRSGENPGPTAKPLYEVKETDDAFGVTVFLPGVTKDSLEITAESGELRIIGRRAWKKPDAWTALYRESADIPYELSLAHDNAFNAEKIAAELRDGVLRISLTKAEALKPRKISVS